MSTLLLKDSRCVEAGSGLIPPPKHLQKLALHGGHGLGSGHLFDERLSSVVITEKFALPYERKNDLHHHAAELRSPLVRDPGQANITAALAFAQVQPSIAKNLSPRLKVIEGSGFGKQSSQSGCGDDPMNGRRKMRMVATGRRVDLLELRSRRFPSLMLCDLIIPGQTQMLDREFTQSSVGNGSDRAARLVDQSNDRRAKHA